MSSAVTSTVGLGHGAPVERRRNRETKQPADAPAKSAETSSTNSTELTSQTGISPGRRRTVRAALPRGPRAAALRPAHLPGVPAGGIVSPVFRHGFLLASSVPQGETGRMVSNPAFFPVVMPAFRWFRHTIAHPFRKWGGMVCACNDGNNFGNSWLWLVIIVILICCCCGWGLAAAAECQLRQRLLLTSGRSAVAPPRGQDRPYSSGFTTRQTSAWMSSTRRGSPVSAAADHRPAAVLPQCVRASVRQLRRYASSCSWMSAWVPVLRPPGGASSAP